MQDLGGLYKYVPLLPPPVAVSDMTVATSLGTCAARLCPRLLPPSIRKSSIDPPIRHASPGATSCRPHFLLRASVCPGLALGWSRIRRKVHL